MRAAVFRVLHARTLLLLSLLIVLSMPLAAVLEDAPAPAGAAYVIEAGALPAAEEAALRQRLKELGFADAAEEAALREGLRTGSWGCGLLLGADWDARLLYTEDAADPELWRGAAMAALFSVRAPYLTQSALEDSGADIPAEAVHTHYNALYDAGSPFQIRLLREDGQPAARHLPRDRALMAGAAAALLGAVFGAALPCHADAVLLRRRVSDGRVRKLHYAAQLLLRFAVLAAAVVLSAALAGHIGLSLRLLPYLLVCTLLATLALELTRSPGMVSVAAALLCLLIPVLCPVYVDLSLAVPRLAAVQKLFLPYWLFYGL